jgi:hypothetical protein
LLVSRWQQRFRKEWATVQKVELFWTRLESS